ncbi:MAG TPA: hypothetical protein VM841_11535, partial [Actinomycetota bacterium]|nr:hypothetical protein [Actinomycetota bacterium]
VTASGIPAVLNGIAAIDVQALAPFPLGIPAPAGHAVLTLQSTFEPPKPRVVSVTLWCTALEPGPAGPVFYGSGPGSDGATWHVSVGQGEILWHVGWSTTASRDAPCGGPRPVHPLIGAAAITP